jgi:hypothetical protein
MDKSKVSGWEKAATLAACIETFVVVITLVFISVQLRQQKELTKAANTQSLVELITPLNLRATDPEMTKLWVMGEEGINQVSDLKEREVKYEQYQTLVSSFLVFYENAYSQCHDGLLDAEIYEGWDKDLATFIEAHKVAKHWDEWKDLYRPGFRDRVSQIIAFQASASPNQPYPKVPC